MPSSRVATYFVLRRVRFFFSSASSGLDHSTATTVVSDSFPFTRSENSGQRSLFCSSLQWHSSNWRQSSANILTGFKRSPWKCLPSVLSKFTQLDDVTILCATILSARTLSLSSFPSTSSFLSRIFRKTSFTSTSFRFPLSRRSTIRPSLQGLFNLSCSIAHHLLKSRFFSQKGMRATFLSEPRVSPPRQNRAAHPQDSCLAEAPLRAL